MADAPAGQPLPPLAEPEPAAGGALVTPPAAGFNLIFHPRGLHVYQLTDPELENLIVGFGSVHLAMFGIALGAALTLAIALITTTMSDRVFATFVATLILAIVLTIYFGIRARQDRSRALTLGEGIRGRARP